ncbi:ribosomal protein S7 domain-containing protein [Coniochaeta sp. 2T2.1]|nr:ribosomal protein S7 domain-containing protein [Coniochaeta sp. 2T2.1]
MPPLLGLRVAFRALSITARPVVRTPIQPGRLLQLRSFADNTTSTPPPQIPGQDGMPIPKSFTGDAKDEPAQYAAEGKEGVEAQSGEAEGPLNQLALDQLQLASYGLDPFDPTLVGHKYGLPELPIPSNMRAKHRYDPVVEQMTRLIMRDGKLSKAQRDMAMILNYLRTSPPPKINPARPLLPGSPPPSHLPLDPVLYLTLAIDSVAPLIRMRGYAGMAGSGKKLEVPAPLALRQRRRTAFQWILDVVEKKKSKGSGRTMFPHKVAEEIVAIMEGRSSVWDKRNLVHRMGTAARANIATVAKRLGQKSSR